MIMETLKLIWLRENEVTVYLALLKLGTTHVGRIVIETQLPKSSIYDALEQLMERGLANKYIHGKTTKFTAEDPEKITHILAQEAKTVKKKQVLFDQILPELYGMTNNEGILPKVRMFQGVEGMREVLNDSLTAREIPYTYVNPEDMEKYFKSINDPYVKKRIETRFRKKVLVVDTPWTREFLKSYIGMQVSEVRFLPKTTQNFHIAMNIYDGKVTYLTYRIQEPIGVIIEDDDIYKLHRTLFETLWSTCI